MPNFPATCPDREAARRRAENPAATQTDCSDSIEHTAPHLYRNRPEFTASRTQKYSK